MQSAKFSLKYGRIEVRFKSEQIVMICSTLTLRTNAITLTPIYLGQKVTRVTVRNVSSEVETQSLLPAIFYRTKNYNILEIAEIEETVWKGRQISKLAQIESKNQYNSFRT